MTARANTVPPIPEPSGAHDVPFQRAMRLADTPPAVVKAPPAMRSPLGSTARASTRGELPPLMPEPRADQAPVAGSYSAMLFASTLPPAAVNWPPTTSLGVCGPGPSGSHIVVARTWPLVPGNDAVVGSKGCQAGVHCAEAARGPAMLTSRANSATKDARVGRSEVGTGMEAVPQRSRGAYRDSTPCASTIRGACRPGVSPGTCPEEVHCPARRRA